eukprot:5621327-Prymnesium_polylepis.1
MPQLAGAKGAGVAGVAEAHGGRRGRYVGRLRKLASGPKEIEAHEPHLRHLLLALAQKSVYPDEYNFDEEEEDEKAFIAFRKELSTLFKGVARVHLSLAQ